MASESPLLHDGAQTVAAANYGNLAGLAGPGGSGQFLAVLLSAAADRTSALVAAAGAQAYGILQNKPALGEVADVGIYGITKAVAGATITRGSYLMTDTSGRLVAWVAGSGYAQLGVAIESAVVGQIFTAYIQGTAVKALT